MEICIYCEDKVKYYEILEINNTNEICCENCFYDLYLDWEELKEDR